MRTHTAKTATISLIFIYLTLCFSRAQELELTSYEIIIDLTSQTMVFKENGKVLKEDICVTGRPGNDDYPQTATIDDWGQRGSDGKKKPDGTRDSTENPGAKMVFFLHLNLKKNGADRGIGIHARGAHIPRWPVTHGCIGFTHDTAKLVFEKIVVNGKIMPNRVIFTGKSPAT